MLKVKQIQSQGIQNNNKDTQEKFASKIKFLKLVLCDKQTIRFSAQICKINFSTAKAILNKFRRQGVIRQQQKDYDSQVDLLKQIVQIQQGIKSQQIQKNKEINQRLNFQLQNMLLKNQWSKTQTHIDVKEMNITALEEELQKEKQKEYKLVEQILEEQIILMKKISH